MTDLQNKAKNIIKSNSRGGFTIPCDTLYPFQWNWDSAFCALGIYTYNKERALREINSLFNGQWENGMIPQIIFHTNNTTYFPGPEIWQSNTTPPSSCISQPPVLATIIWYMMTLGLEDKSILNNYFDKLIKYHKWFVKNRDPYNKGLLSIIHPWESGRDNSPDWDSAINAIKIDDSIHLERKDNTHIDEKQRPTNDDYNRYMQIVYKCKELNWDNKKIYDEGLFNVCDPGIQFIFIRACKDLYKIAVYLQRTEYYDILEEWIEHYSTNCNKLWNIHVNAYSSLNIKTGELHDCISCASMLYAYANIGSKEQRNAMIKHSKRILHATKYGFPSYDPHQKRFNSKKYWRGPVWCIINFMLSIGFASIKEVELSKKIKTNTSVMIENNGFFEYFDPYEGRGYGGDNFSWTAAVYLIFRNELFI